MTASLLGTADAALFFGAAYAGVVIAMAIALRILDFPDLTIEGSFPLGAAVCAACLVSGIHPAVAFLAAGLAGAVAGSLTAILHTKLGVSRLLAGILMLAILYSVNLRIMGSSNISLLLRETPLSKFEEWDSSWMNGFDVGATIHPATILLLFTGLVILKILIDLFFRTGTGIAIRAVGDNSVFAKNFGISTEVCTIAGLALSNGIAAISGGIVASSQGFSDIGMGQGVLVISLAGLIIGEVAWRYRIGRPDRVAWLTGAAIVGSVLYQGIVYASIQAGLPATDVKMVTAVLVLIVIVIRFRRRDRRTLFASSY